MIRRTNLLRRCSLCHRSYPGILLWWKTPYIPSKFPYAQRHGQRHSYLKLQNWLERPSFSLSLGHGNRYHSYVPWESPPLVNTAKPFPLWEPRSINRFLSLEPSILRRNLQPVTLMPISKQNCRSHSEGIQILASAQVRVYVNNNAKCDGTVAWT